MFLRVTPTSAASLQSGVDNRQYVRAIAVDAGRAEAPNAGEAFVVLGLGHGNLPERLGRTDSVGGDPIYASTVQSPFRELCIEFLFR
jgi:hypothetical protein